jgi:CRISPR-associated protein Cas1
LEHKVFNLNDFVRTDNYILRVRPKGVQKLLNAVSEQFSKTVKYKKRNYQWNTVMDMKVHELSDFLVGKRKTIDFSIPTIKLYRDDNTEMRNKILDISYSDWNNMGFSKGTLHYLKKNASSGRSFTVNKHVRERLMAIE